MPPDLAQQMPYLRKFCRAMRIPVLQIRARSRRHHRNGRAASVEANLYPVIVTLDKDLNIVDPVLILNTSKDVIIDREKVMELFGVTPNRFLICSACGTHRTIFPALPASAKKPLET
jgi:hypothetical protein